MSKHYLTVVTHYEFHDTEFMGDYYDIEILDEQDDIIIQYGDCYHDKGEEKTSGFIEGFKHAVGHENVEVTYIKLADRDY